MRLIQKKALVTGGGAGLGLAIARALAAQGAQVAIWEYNPDLLPALSKEFPQAGMADDLDITCAANIAEAERLGKGQGRENIASNRFQRIDGPRRPW